MRFGVGRLGVPFYQGSFTHDFYKRRCVPKSIPFGRMASSVQHNPGDMRNLFALFVLLSTTLPLLAQETWYMSNFAGVGGDDSGFVNAGLNDHAAFMRAQEEIQAYYVGGGQGPGTLILQPGEYIIGNQLLGSAVALRACKHLAHQNDSHNWRPRSTSAGSTAASRAGRVG